MRKIILSMMMTLDGYSEGPKGEMDWLPPFNEENKWKDLHEEMWNQLNSVDTLLLGRVTYQIWERYWPAAATNPSSSQNDIKFSKYVDEVNKIVFSRTLKEVKWKNSRLIKDNIKEEMLKLKSLSGKNITLAGGINIAQTFMNLDLIDKYIVIIHPVILGNGKPLFKNVTNKFELDLIETKRYQSGAIGLYYQRKNNMEE